MTARLALQCAKCRHYRGIRTTTEGPIIYRGIRTTTAGSIVYTRTVCDAFPTAIPAPIVRDEFDHRQPFRGDQGIRFEPVEGERHPNA